MRGITIECSLSRLADFSLSKFADFSLSSFSEFTLSKFENSKRRNIASRILNAQSDKSPRQRLCIRAPDLTNHYSFLVTCLVAIVTRLLLRLATKDNNVFTKEGHNLSQYLGQTLNEAFLDLVVTGSVWHVGPDVFTDSYHGYTLAEHADEYGSIEVMSIEVIWHFEASVKLMLMLLDEGAVQD